MTFRGALLSVCIIKSFRTENLGADPSVKCGTYGLKELVYIKVLAWPCLSSLSPLGDGSAGQLHCPACVISVCSPTLSLPLSLHYFSPGHFLPPNAFFCLLVLLLSVSPPAPRMYISHILRREGPCPE